MSVDFSSSFSVSTGSRLELINITPAVAEAVRKSGVAEGVCHIFIPHTTAAVTINENADPDVRADILMALNKIVPAGLAYEHSEGNSQAHVMSSLVGPSESVFVENGRLALGTWQGIYFCEFDGPRIRKVYVKVVEG